MRKKWSVPAWRVPWKKSFVVEGEKWPKSEIATDRMPAALEKRKNLKIFKSAQTQQSTVICTFGTPISPQYSCVFLSFHDKRFFGGQVFSPQNGLNFTVLGIFER